jgi:pimeloyl-ACP methyl ester carboxylesterase/DNA-binding CsgD family transcriptional regulator
MSSLQIPVHGRRMEPETRYARSGLLSIAYRASGDGPLDLVMVPGFISHVEYAWKEPSLARFLRKLSAFCRVIAFDKRGMGLSDRDPLEGTPSLEERMDDVRAVMDAAASKRAVLFAWSEGGPMSILFAAKHPERVAALILVGTTPRFSAAPDFAEGIPRWLLEEAVETWREGWGSGVGLDLYGPSVADDDRLRTWWAAYQRFAASPGAVAASLRMHLDVDVRSCLPRIEAPTLIVHRVDDMLVPVTCARYMAERISNARYLELPGSDHMFWLGDQDKTLNALRRFLAETAEGAAIGALKQRRRRPSTGWESLTEAELDVVRLVAEGLTNRQIASRLYVSPRTVQTHVAHVFAKLGVSRRAEVAAEASRRL